jgi:predicted anti-sigma-YlaC factor YlaD
VIITDCEKISELLPDYINRALPADMNNIVISHLAACRECREETALLIKIKSLAEADAKEVPREIIRSAFVKIPREKTVLEKILSSGSVFMAFDIIRYSLYTADRTIKFACRVI